jgi:hypothetical protein
MPFSVSKKTKQKLFQKHFLEKNTLMSRLLIGQLHRDNNLATIFQRERI